MFEREIERYNTLLREYKTTVIVPYLQMMENAGMAAYAELQKQFPHPGRLLVVCGKGNNGGDGFVIARAAAKDGWNVTVLLAEGEPKTADAILNFERLHSLPVHICTDGSVLETQSFAAVASASPRSPRGSCRRTDSPLITKPSRR